MHTELSLIRLNPLSFRGYSAFSTSWISILSATLRDDTLNVPQKQRAENRQSGLKICMPLCRWVLAPCACIIVHERMGRCPRMYADMYRCCGEPNTEIINAVPRRHENAAVAAVCLLLIYTTHSYAATFVWIFEGELSVPCSERSLIYLSASSIRAERKESAASAIYHKKKQQ